MLDGGEAPRQFGRGKEPGCLQLRQPNRLRSEKAHHLGGIAPVEHFEPVRLEAPRWSRVDDTPAA